MAHDPVCSGEVNESSPWSSTYEEKTYFFTSAECKADFDKDPVRYASQHTGAAKEAGAKIKEQGQRMASRARTKLGSVIGSQKDKVADGISSLSVALETASQRLREQNQENFAQYTDKAASRVLDFSGYLQTSDPEEIISQAEDYIRRRPAWMIGGALAAGFLMARFLKSSKSVAA